MKAILKGVGMHLNAHHRIRSEERWKCPSGSHQSMSLSFYKLNEYFLLTLEGLPKSDSGASVPTSEMEILMPPLVGTWWEGESPI